MEYTIDYFIQKFEKIPTEEIGKGDLDQHCALYHCGLKNNLSYEPTEEATALAKIFKKVLPAAENVEPVYLINDGSFSSYSPDPSFKSAYLQRYGSDAEDHPKDRILFTLNYIKQHFDA